VVRYPATATAGEVIRERSGTVTNFSLNVVVLDTALQPTLFVTVFRLIARGMDEHRVLVSGLVPHPDLKWTDRNVIDSPLASWIS
jgi:hypothetical protein